MKRIKMDGLDIAKSAFRLVYRPDTAHNFTQRLASPADGLCLLLAISGGSADHTVRRLYPQVRKFRC